MPGIRHNVSYFYTLIDDVFLPKADWLRIRKLLQISRASSARQGLAREQCRCLRAIFPSFARRIVFIRSSAEHLSSFFRAVDVSLLHDGRRASLVWLSTKDCGPFYTYARSCRLAYMSTWQVCIGRRGRSRSPWPSLSVAGWLAI